MRFKVAGLTLALAMGVASIVAAQESGSILSRVLPSGSKNEPARKADTAVDSPKSPSLPPTRLIKAKADLERRQAVCLKLIDIANSTGDEELRRRAEMLDQRAWDIFLATTSRLRDSERAIGEASAKELGLTKDNPKGGKK